MCGSVQQVKNMRLFGLASPLVGSIQRQCVKCSPISTNPQISDLRAAGNVLRSQEATFRSQLNPLVGRRFWDTPLRLPVLGTSVLQRALKRRLEAN